MYTHVFEGGRRTQFAHVSAVSAPVPGHRYRTGTTGPVPVPVIWHAQTKSCEAQSQTEFRPCQRPTRASTPHT